MDYKRARDIVGNKEIVDVFYNEQPVWIQEVNDNIAKIGYVNKNVTQDVYLEDLYESNLYN